jgi:solute carrier family 25 carnitine/acylcarnitine transporter 20/29
LTLTVGLDPTSIDFIAGTIGGVAGLIVGHPFDTVKVRFQTPDLRQKYRSTFHALATISREEKFVGLYKGITSPLASCALLNGLIFASYRFFMRIQLDDKDAIPSLTQVTLAGIATGIVTSLITTPTDLIKIQQQNSLLEKPSVKTVALRMYKQRGIRGLYRGITATILRDVGYGAYFGSYEATCRILAPSPDHLAISTAIQSDVFGPSWSTSLIAGGVAGIVGWLVTFPMDVVKTRMQGSDWTPLAASTSVKPPERVRLIGSTLPGQPSLIDTVIHEDQSYRTTLSTIVNSYRAEGIGVFYRGLAPTLIRAIPVNMATFVVFEISVRALS